MAIVRTALDLGLKNFSRPLITRKSVPKAFGQVYEKLNKLDNEIQSQDSDTLDSFSESSSNKSQCDIHEATAKFWASFEEDKDLTFHICSPVLSRMTEEEWNLRENIDEAPGETMEDSEKNVEQSLKPVMEELDLINEGKEFSKRCTIISDQIQAVPVEEIRDLVNSKESRMKKRKKHVAGEVTSGKSMRYGRPRKNQNKESDRLYDHHTRARGCDGLHLLTYPTCDVCNMDFYFERDLVRHKATKHSSYICNSKKNCIA